MKTVAFVTSKQFPDSTPDDRLVVEYLLLHGVRVRPAVWNDPAVCWDAFDRIILRSPWDYSFEFENFLIWIQMLEKKNLPISNPYPILYWNMNKNYLRDIQKKGFPVIPTLWLKKGSSASLCDLLKKQQWKKAVIKPVISAGGHQTWLASLENSSQDQIRFQEMLSGSDLMVQEFMESVVTEGEWALVFFNCEWSHSVLKKPGQGEFRVQERYGGFIEKKDPSFSLIGQAKELVDSIKPSCLYARVDGIEENGKLILMELELLEPALFLASDPKAPERFASAIRSILTD